MATLYLVSTPIGNLEDITLRAIRILSEIDVIACEDTRKTGLLLKKVIPGAKKRRLLSYYEGNEAQRIPEIVKLLKAGQKVALVTNAGTPLISDPGYKLVKHCLKENIPIKPVPGSLAVLAALVVSGLPTDKFLFFGFLPKKEGKKKKFLNQLALILKMIKVTVIIFESPHRLIKTLVDVKKVFGDIEITVARELTKIHEEIRREKISQALKYFRKRKPKGELTLLFSGKNSD